MTTWKLVPTVPTPDMLKAGNEQDWVGEIEGRTGDSIMPNPAVAETMKWHADAGDENPYLTTIGPNFRNAGIWPAMLDAAPDAPALLTRDQLIAAANNIDGILLDRDDVVRWLNQCFAEPLPGITDTQRMDALERTIQSQPNRWVVVGAKEGVHLYRDKMSDEPIRKPTLREALDELIAQEQIRDAS